MKIIITLVMFLGFASENANAIKIRTAQRMCEGTWENPCTRDDAPAGTIACCNAGEPANRTAGKPGKVVGLVSAKKVTYLNGSRPLDAEEIAIINKKLLANPRLREQFEGK
jgi:hypothetical protein